MKNKKFLSIILVSIMTLGLLTGCGSKAYMSDSIESMYVGSSDSLNVMGMGTNSSSSNGGFSGSFGSSNSMQETSKFTDVYDYELETETSTSVDVPVIENTNEKNYLEKKLVYTANVEAQTKDMTKAKESIDKMIQEFEGYVETEYSYKNGGFDYGYTRTTLDIKIRIPGPKFNDFLNGLEGENIYINNMNKSSVDYSTTYYDKESRINSLRIQEERLYDLLANASDVDIMLRIENQLADIRYEIESLTKEMKFIDSNVDYSTINLKLEEVVKYDVAVEEPESFFDELKDVIKYTTRDFTEWCKNALFSIIYMLPFLVVFAIVILIIILPIKHKIRKKKAKKELQNKEENNK